MNQYENKKVYGPGHNNLTLEITITIAILAAVLYHSFVDQSFIPGEAHWVYGIAVLAIIYTSARIWGYMNQVPNITLTTEGIKKTTLLGSEFYKWRETGVFTIISSLHERYEDRYLCAFNDKNHDIFNDNIETTDVEYNEADISMKINDLVAGETDSRANDLVKEVNKWREKFGAPENNTYHIHPLEKEKARTKRKRKKLIIKVLSFALVFSLIILDHFYF